MGQSLSPPRPARVGHVLEGSVAPVAVEGIRPPARDEQVRAAVAVDVADRDAMAVSAGKAADAGRFGHVLEGAVSPIVKQPIARARGGGCDVGGSGERAALDA